MNQLINQTTLQFSQFHHNIYHRTSIAPSSSRLSGCLFIDLPICLEAAHIADRVPTERIPVVNGWFVSVCLSVCLFHNIPRTWIDHRTGDGMKIIGMGSDSGDGVECAVE